MNAEAIALARIRARAVQAEQKADAALAAARAIPPFLHWEQQRDTLRFQIAHNKAYGLDFGDLNAELEDAKRNLARVAQENGVDMDAFRPLYRCPLCNDTGYVNGAPCKCLRDEMVRVLQEQSGLPAGATSDLSTLADGLPEGDTKTRYTRFYHILLRYADAFPAVYRYLAVTGATSTGKTYALSALANTLMQRGFSALVLSAYQLNQMFLEYHLAEHARKAALMEPLLQAEFLLIDDLGSEPLYQNVTLPYLLNLLALRTLPTAITTNMNATELSEHYGDRICARLFNRKESLLCTLAGYDFRLNIT